MDIRVELLRLMIEMVKYELGQGSGGILSLIGDVITAFNQAIAAVDAAV